MSSTARAPRPDVLHVKRFFTSPVTRMAWPGSLTLGVRSERRALSRWMWARQPGGHHRPPHATTRAAGRSEDRPDLGRCARPGTQVRHGCRPATDNPAGSDRKSSRMASSPKCFLPSITVRIAPVPRTAPRRLGTPTLFGRVPDAGSPLPRVGPLRERTSVPGTGSPGYHPRDGCGAASRVARGPGLIRPTYTSSNCVRVY